MIRVNLIKADRGEASHLPPAEEPGARRKKPARVKAGQPKAKAGEAARKTPLGNLIVALSVVLLGALALLQSRALSRERSLLATAQDEVRRLQPVVDKLDEIEWQKLYLEKKVALIRDLRAQQGLAVGILDAVSRDIPEWVWLTELVLNKAGVLVKGRALTLVLVSDFVRDLERSGPFASVGIVNTQQRTEGNNSYIEFTLNATLLPVAAPSAADGAAKPAAAAPAAAAPAAGGPR
jgi:type IV pilus assembly protein PilN